MVRLNGLSVFFPAYNEEGNISTTVKRALRILPEVAEKWEIIIVDDGSQDRTPQISDSLARTNKSIRVIHHKPNRGYGGALKSGYNAARYPWVAFTDSDGQFDLSEIKEFIKKAYSAKADLILGYRINRADSFMRKVYTFVWSHILPRVLFGLSVRDYSCGFWLIKKKVYDSILPLVGEEKVTKIEMLAKAKRKGYKFAEVGVHHYPRKFGKQTGANIKVVLRSVKDLLKLWLKVR